jgi:uncharacterized membrane protein
MYKEIFIILIIILIIDLPVILFINKDIYQNQFKTINNSDIKITNNTYIGAFITYLLLAFGLYHFIIKNYNINTLSINSALLGLVVYGIYNFTNLATINNYTLNTAIVDTLWGCTLFTLVSNIYIHYF